MREVQVREGIIIDDVNAVVNSIYEYTGIIVKDPEVIKTFINNEINTLFYVDEKMNISAERIPGSKYVWLDTGFIDYNGNPIFISLLNSWNEYFGHFTGTVKDIANSNKNKYPRYKTDITRNQQNFMNKYKNRIAKRVHEHIEDEQEYLIGRCNETEELSDWAKQLMAPDFTSFEENITVGLLMEKIEVMDNYIKELHAIIETIKNKGSQQIEELERKNKEYKESLARITRYQEQEKQPLLSNNDEGLGHMLLGRGGKVLVIGATELGTDVMQAIAKREYGFDKKDIEFETDYAKIVLKAGRIQIDGKYKAVIMGSMPHKVAGLGDHSSLVEKLKHFNGDIISVDARSKSGEFRISKDSYRNAMSQICSMLKQNLEAYAC